MKKKYQKKKSSPGYKIPMTELKGLEAVLDLIILAMWTPYVLGEKIVSLMILAPPESGKTEAMKKIRFNKGIYILRRFTACGFIKDLLANKIPILFKVVTTEKEKSFAKRSLKTFRKKEFTLHYQKNMQ